MKAEINKATLLWVLGGGEDSPEFATLCAQLGESREKIMQLKHQYSDIWDEAHEKIVKSYASDPIEVSKRLAKELLPQVILAYLASTAELEGRDRNKALQYAIQHLANISGAAVQPKDTLDLPTLPVVSINLRGNDG